ncbi:MAG: hypothetical protein M3N19_02320 [Candidatus Eremiobacteraeota bacterium]|nr:hypothetical protein [Candidatus Eremiobacteraeota bacterium]
MARYKVLKGVAHAIGHSFTSLMNYSGGDYVMGHILRLARNYGCDTLTIDFVREEAGPSELLAEPIAAIPAYYMHQFWNQVRTSGSDRSLIRSATLILRYDLATKRPFRWNSPIMESPYSCQVRITDIRGKGYVAQFDGWWYPEV